MYPILYITKEFDGYTAKVKYARYHRNLMFLATPGVHSSFAKSTSDRSPSSLPSSWLMMS